MVFCRNSPFGRLPPRVLIVENDPETARAITYLLESAGLAVTVARTGAEGFELARHADFDLVTVEGELPDADALEVCAGLRQDFRFERTPILLILPDVTEADRRRGQQAGATEVIAKPLGTTSFISRVLSHLKRVKGLK
jgi:DNA-binding response OmpR family regulator